jgi:hypothetical protein
MAAVMNRMQVGSDKGLLLSDRSRNLLSAMLSERSPNRGRSFLLAG